MVLLDAQVPGEQGLPMQQPAQEQQVPTAPEPKAIGNDKVAILSHSLTDVSMDPVDQSRHPAAIELALGNESGQGIATALLEARFLDIEGNVLDTVRQKEVDLRANGGRRVRITSSEYRFDTVKSYEVRVLRTTTADTEKVQARRHDMRTTAAGEELLHGIVKNVSQVTIDAAVLVTFFNAEKETVGTRAVILREIEPGTVREYQVTFKPQEGDVVRSFSLGVAEIVA